MIPIVEYYSEGWNRWNMLKPLQHQYIFLAAPFWAIGWSLPLLIACTCSPCFPLLPVQRSNIIFFKAARTWACLKMGVMHGWLLAAQYPPVPFLGMLQTAGRSTLVRRNLVAVLSVPWENIICWVGDLCFPNGKSNVSKRCFSPFPPVSFIFVGGALKQIQGYEQCSRVLLVISTWDYTGILTISHGL